MSNESSRLNLVFSYSLRGGAGFGVGGLLVLFAEWFYFSRPYEADIPFHVLIIAYFLSGACGAAVLLWELGSVIRAAVGFGFGFVVTSFAVFFTMLSLQAAARPEYGWGATGCGVGFALGGFIGGLSIRGKLAIAGALSFGIAGALWGPLMFWQAWPRGEPQSASLIDYIGILIFLFPYLIGGALFGAVVGAMIQNYGEAEGSEEAG